MFLKDCYLKKTKISNFELFLIFYKVINFIKTNINNIYQF